MNILLKPFLYIILVRLITQPARLFTRRRFLPRGLNFCFCVLLHCWTLLNEQHIFLACLCLSFLRKLFLLTHDRVPEIWPFSGFIKKNEKAQWRLRAQGRGWVRAFCKFSLLPDVHRLFVAALFFSWPSDLLVSPPVAGQWPLRGFYILRRWMRAEGVIRTSSSKNAL